MRVKDNEWLILDFCATDQQSAIEVEELASLIEAISFVSVDFANHLIVLASADLKETMFLDVNVEVLSISSEADVLTD